MRCENATFKERRRIYWVLLIATVIGIICANFANWLSFPDLWNYSIIDRFTLGGFSFYHGMLKFLGVLCLLLRLFSSSHRFWINEIIPSIILFNVIARIGCMLAGCCYGVHIHEITIQGFTIDVFPVRLIEIVCMTVLLFVFKKKVTQNRLFWYLLNYSIIKFILEFFRGDDRGKLLIDWLTPAQIISIVIWIGLVAFILIRYFKYLPLLKPIEDYEPNINELQYSSIKYKLLKSSISIFLIIAIIFTWTNPYDFNFLSFAKVTLYNFVGDFFKESSIVTYDEQGNAIIDIKEKPAIAKIELEQNKTRLFLLIKVRIANKHINLILMILFQLP